MTPTAEPPKPWPLSGLLLAAFALAMLVLAWAAVLAPLGRSHFPIDIADGGGGPTIAALRGGAPAELRVSPGDRLDISGLSYSDRKRLAIGSPPGTALTLPVYHDGAWSPRTFVASVSPKNGLDWADWTTLLLVSVTLLIVGGLAARRPSVATAGLVLYGAGAVNSFDISRVLSWLPNPLFGAVSTVLIAAVSDLPLYALLIFVTRFPHLPRSAAARLRMKLGDGIFAAAAAFAIFAAIAEPIAFVSWKPLWPVFDAIGTICVAAFAILAYNEATGEDRRRVGWVLAGFIVSSACYFANNYLLVTVSAEPSLASVGGAGLNHLLVVAIYLGTCALPLALLYAVLRHRVIDIGFALNRTLVYALITGAIVVVVSLVDWLSGKLISESRFALAVEALITIAFGVTLNWLHGRIERVVDRVIFRERHIASGRIEHRIEALAFSTSESSIDAALTEDAANVLRLRSAAVFRRNDASGTFTRRHGVNWPPECGVILDQDSLLLRSIRAIEKPIFLADLAIVDPDLPAGPAKPVLAVPIATQHELIGFALYGNEVDGASPDPEVVSLLARLAASAATRTRWSKPAAGATAPRSSNARSKSATSSRIDVSLDGQNRLPYSLNTIAAN